MICRISICAIHVLDVPISMILTQYKSISGKTTNATRFILKRFTFGLNIVQKKFIYATTTTNCLCMYIQDVVIYIYVCVWLQSHIVGIGMIVKLSLSHTVYI